MNQKRWIRATEAGAALLLSLSCVTGCAVPRETQPEHSDLTVLQETDTTAATEATVSAPPVTEQTAATDLTSQEPPRTYTLPELIHCTAAEIIQIMGGEYELIPDPDLSGYFYFCNERVFPQTRFYFVDSSFEYIPQGIGSLGEYEDDIRAMLMNSGIQIDKINTYPGGMEIDGYSAGKRYLEYAEKIHSDSFCFGNYGEYFCGAPASSAYSYSDKEHNAQITLHFELTGDYMTKEKFITDTGSFPAYIMEQDNPELGLITVLRSDGYPKAEFTVATASSVLAPDTSGDTPQTYEAENVLDGDLSTCWAEGVDGLGCGESITLSAAEPQTVSTICIYGGLQTDEAHFRNNARPTELLAEFDDGSVYRVWVSDKLDYSGVSIFLCSGKKTASIKLTLQAVTAGERYQDTCISEITFE